MSGTTLNKSGSNIRIIGITGAPSLNRLFYIFNEVGTTEIEVGQIGIDVNEINFMDFTSSNDLLAIESVAELAPAKSSTGDDFLIFGTNKIGIIALLSGT